MGKSTYFFSDSRTKDIKLLIIETQLKILLWSIRKRYQNTSLGSFDSKFVAYDYEKEDKTSLEFFRNGYCYKDITDAIY